MAAASEPGKAQAAPQASAAAPAPAPTSAQAPSSAPSSASAPSPCELHALAGKWVGSCGRILDETPTLTLAPAAPITSGVWRRGAKPEAVWAGTMSVEDSPNAPLELEVDAGGSGVLRWNRADNRKCPPVATSWSLYCATGQAAKGTLPTW